jgi:DNA-binding NtrC family response regulator
LRGAEGGAGRTAVRRHRILLIDDDADVRGGLKRFLQLKGYQVDEAGTCREAEVALAASPPDAVLLDENLPDGSGVDLLPRLKEAGPSVPVLVLTGHGTIDLAVRAIREGAEQFLTKPVDLQALVVILERLLETQRNRQKADATQASRRTPDPFAGSSDAIRRLEEEANRVLEAERPVLIRGETGSGKGVLARWLHDNGPRRNESFVEINCAGLSRELLESELFGHEVGAFTGATRAKPGLLEVAHRGTAFLDEIGDMDLVIQPKLLGVLEQRRFRRLGDVRDRHVDVRLVAATHQDLGRFMAEARFRQDLYYRISTLPLAVPPLRERREDIAVLAQRILEAYAVELGRGPSVLSAAVLGALRAYDWPGNVRELRNVLERALLYAERGEVRVDHLQFGPPGERPADRDPGALLTLAEMEQRHIRRALELEGGHVARTAQRLGVSTSSLYERLKRYQIDRSDS